MGETLQNDAEYKSTLVSRNITIFGRRTSVRLEPEMWVGLREIAEREQCNIHEICTLVSVRKSAGTSLTAAIRVFLMLYFRASSTEEGHVRAGHGNFENMKTRARIPEEYQKFFKSKPVTVRVSQQDIKGGNFAAIGVWQKMQSSQAAQERAR